MPQLQGTRTEKNLMDAFSGESQARNKYTYYASKAKKDGFEQIAAIFQQTADNEKEHAKIWFKKLHNGEIPSTAQNLSDAAEGEHYEWVEMYKNFAEIAREEGFPDIGALFEMVGKIEKHHEERYRTLLQNLNDNALFKKGDQVYWICRNCGHIHHAAVAPGVCPVCTHPQSYFELLNDSF